MNNKTTFGFIRHNHRKRIAMRSSILNKDSKNYKVSEPLIELKDRVRGYHV